MQINFQFEAQLRQLAGSSERTVTISAESSLHQALQQVVVADDGPLRERILNEDGTIQASLLLFVNDVAVPSDAAAEYGLNDGDQVLLLPPISGG